MSSSGAADRVQNHGVALSKGRNRRVRCNYCAKEVGGFNRLQHHLGHVGPDVSPCLQAPDDVKECMRTILMERRKGKLLKEVDELVHPELPLKRHLVPAIPEPKRRPTQPSTSAEVFATIVKIEDVNGCNVNLLHASSSGTAENAASSIPVPMEAVNVANLTSTMPEDVDTVGKQGVEGPELLAAKCIGRFFYEAGVELTGIKLPSFQKMIDAVISCGAGYKPPAYDGLMGWILQQEVVEVREHIENIKASWERTGCSILLDIWTDQKGRILMGFLVDCPQGTIFLRSVDVSDAVHDVDALFLLLSRVVEEVGPRNVVQVMAHDTSCYIEAAKKMLVESYKTIFWASCADVCIDMMLEKIGMRNHVKKVLTRAKSITRFIYSHALPLELMKRHIRGGVLVKASKLKSAAHFITLQNMVSERENLIHMFSSPAWNASVWASKTKGKNISALVKSSFFWAAAKYVLKITDPLVGVLHLISEGNAAPMGVLYDALDQAKAAIMVNLENEKAKYEPYWTLIDDIWNNQLHNPLHSAGYYLNPSLFYSSDFYIDAEVTTGLLFCIVRMVEDQHIQKLIVQQLDDYRETKGGFSEPMAIAQRTTLSPVLWWSLYGGKSPELQRVAIKILSQTCSSSSRYKLRKGLSEQLHMKGGNCIEQQRFRDVEFVRNNLHLRHSSSSRDDTSLEDINPLDDWIVEI